VCPRGTDHEGGLTRLYAPIRNNHKTGEVMKAEKIKIDIYVNETLNIDKKKLPEVKKKFSEFFVAIGKKDGVGWTATSDKEEVFGIAPNNGKFYRHSGSRIIINERDAECILKDENKQEKT
jgi:hypothetical protein